MWPKKAHEISKKIAFIFCYALVLTGIYLLKLHSYLLFHTIVELFSVSVAFAIFMIFWNSREYIDNGYLLFVGIAYLFIGIIDLIHTLAYEGMGVFPEYGTNLATQLWISARYIESISLVIAFLFFRRRLKVRIALLAYSAFSCLVLLSIFYCRIFPVCFVEQKGLTEFKEISEFVIIAILSASLFLLLRNRDKFEPKVLRWVGWSIGFTMMSELLFTMYARPYGSANMFGHFLKLISFYLIYKALIETGLREPYNLLFRDLKASEYNLQKAHDELEIRVQQRTAELSQSEEKFRRMAETIPDVFWMSTPGIEKMIYVSPAYEKIWGCSRESLYESPKSFIDHVHPEDTEKVVSTLSNHAKGCWNIEYRIQRSDGSTRWIMDRGFPVFDEQGNISAMTGVATDITQLKHMENVLREQTSALEAFFKHTITPLVFLDRNFNFIRVNEAYARACQREVSEFAGHNHFELYPHEENQRIFEQVVKSKTPYQAFAKPFCFPDHPEWGITYWDWTLVPILSETGEVQFLVFSLKDVTERKKAEMALREKEQHLRTIISHAPIVLFAIDRQGKITLSEGKALVSMGIKSGESVGENAFERYQDRPEILRNVRRALNGESFTTEVNMPGDRLFEASYSPIRDEKENIIGVMGVAVDITVRKEAERKILADKEDLRALTSELLITEERERHKIAIDLHDSVGQILAFLKIELGNLQRSGIPRNLDEVINHIRKQVEQAIKQTRTLTFDISPPELYTLGFESAVEELAQRFAEKGNFQCLFETTDEPKPLSEQVKILLYRSVRELLINATKHSRAKVVRIDLCRVNDNIQITVQDDGVGFSMSDLEEASRDKTVGFGLLSIRQRLMHIGGKIDIQCGNSIGTTIKLLAPLKHKRHKERSP